MAAPARGMKVFSGFPRLGAALGSRRPDLHHEYIGSSDGSSWRAVLSWLPRAIEISRSRGWLVFNNDHRRLFLTCLLYALVAPRPLRRCRIVSVDLLLQADDAGRGRLARWVKRLALRQVDLFVLYFRDIEGYVRHYGIRPDRTVYVPFKVNSWEKLSRRAREVGEGSHVLLAGATHRDHATFVEAVRRTRIPAVIVVPGWQRPAIEGAAWHRAGLPPWVRVEYHTDGDEETYLRYFERASVVCVPRFRRDIGCSGISAYLCAMALGRCVVISRGPGADDVLPDEAALLFDAEDPGDLARVLERAWSDDRLRRRTAAAGARYAGALGGEERLLRDIVAVLDSGGRPGVGARTIARLPVPSGGSNP